MSDGIVPVPKEDQDAGCICGINHPPVTSAIHDRLPDGAQTELDLKQAKVDLERAREAMPSGVPSTEYHAQLDKVIALQKAINPLLYYETVTFQEQMIYTIWIPQGSVVVEYTSHIDFNLARDEARRVKGYLT